MHKVVFGLFAQNSKSSPYFLKSYTGCPSMYLSIFPTNVDYRKFELATKADACQMDTKNCEKIKKNKDIKKKKILKIKQILTLPTSTAVLATVSQCRLELNRPRLPQAKLWLRARACGHGRPSFELEMWQPQRPWDSHSSVCPFSRCPRSSLFSFTDFLIKSFQYRIRPNPINVIIKRRIHISVRIN